MADNLVISVFFKGLDKLSAPLRAIASTSNRTAQSLKATSQQVAALAQSQRKIATFKRAEADLKATAAQLQSVKAHAASLRAEMNLADAPVRKLTTELAKAGAQEAKLIAIHENQGKALQRLSSELSTAGIDTTNLAEHEERLALRLRETSQALDMQRAKIQGLAAARSRALKLQSTGQGIKNVGTSASIGVTLPVVGLFGAAIKAAGESSQAIAQVNASLRSMGPVAGRTAPQLQALASHLQDISLYDDDDILRKVTANMLTFGNIQGNVFDRAQKAVIDYAAKENKDLQESTIMISKALNDPGKAISALSKSGAVSKGWIDANKDLLQALVDTGQTAKAQGIILGEFERQYKDSATAAREANPIAATAQEGRTALENLGAVLLNVLPPFAKELTKILKAFNSLSPGTQTFVVGVLAVSAVIGPVLGVIGSLISIIGALQAGYAALAISAEISGTSVLAAFAAVALPVIAVIAAIAGVIAIGVAIRNHWSEIGAFFSALWSSVGSAASTAAAGISSAFFGAMKFIRDAFQFGVALAKAGIRFVVDRIVNGLATLTETLANIGRNAISGLINGILGGLPALGRALGLVSDKTKSVPQQKLQIKSPSRVFMEMGGHVMRGLAIGVDGAAALPLRSLAAIGAQMAGALAAGPLAAATSPGTGPGFAFGAPQIATPARAAQPSPAGASFVIQSLTINAQPGQDGAAIARQFQAEMDKFMRQQAAAKRARYQDDA